MSNNEPVSISATFLEVTNKTVKLTVDGQIIHVLPLYALTEKDFSLNVEGEWITIDVPRWLAESEQLEFHQGES